MNEEKVKNEIIVPFFEKLGFNIADIEYETSFCIRLGRQTHEINGAKDRASGRLDILYKKGDQNLFIVETKPRTQQLNEEDKKQAISYARLLSQIAPFALLTNGTETKIYDVLTMEELSEDTILESRYVKSGYSISLSSELRYEALKIFVGLNSNNLKVFCQKQVNANIRNLIADKKSPERKFIQETYLRREGLIEKFQRFIEYKPNNKGKNQNSDIVNVFAIIGESGFGKTNAMIDLAKEYVNSNPVLFFNGSRINCGILEEIAYDFNWEFEPERTGLAIIKKLSDIFSQKNSNLIIFIDAIDEVPSENFEIDLDNFVKNISDKNIRICLSCKESLWQKFLLISSDSSHIKSCLFRDGIHGEGKFSFSIGAFSNCELDIAIKKYSDAFKLPKIEGKTRILCKNPLFLRILSEIYKDAKNIPPDVINHEVLGKYIERKIEKSRSPEKDLRFLSIFGRRLFDSNKEVLFQDEVNNGLDLPEFLISFSILRRTKDELGRYSIGFQYDYIRDFIICYHSLKLDKMSQDQITELMKHKIDEDLPRSVFRYFERLAQNDVKKAIRVEFSKYNYKRAHDFLNCYQQILDCEFPLIKNRFYPFTSGEIGLLVFYHLDPYFSPPFGFRSVLSGEKKVIWLEKENWFDESEGERLRIARENGVRLIFSSSPDFREIEPEQYARDQIVGTLKQIIESRGLDESNNFVLMEEYILNMMSNFHNWLNLPDFNEVFWQKALPVSIDYLIERACAVIKQVKSVGRNVPPPTDFIQLLIYLRKIKNKKSTINKTLLPFPAKSKIPRLGAWLINEYSLDELKEYLVTFFQLVLQEYKTLVDHNLPHFRNKMKTYKTLPTRVIGEIEGKKNNLGFNYCLVPGKDEIKVEISYKKATSIFEHITNGLIVHTPTGDLKINCYHMAVMDLFFETDSSKDNIIQKAVYKLVYDDLRQLCNWSFC